MVRSRCRSDADDQQVHLRSRVIGVLPAAVCLVAAALMGVAAFLPYTGWYGDGLEGCCAPPQQVSVSLINGSDVLFVLGTVIALSLFAACHLARIRRHLTGRFALGVSLVALGLALKLPGTYMQDGVTYGQPYLLDAGFYLFLGGAVAAVIAALLMVVTGFGTARTGTETKLSSAHP
jgi:hypothetical protein